jgi:hypothetical protein
MKKVILSVLTVALCVAGVVAGARRPDDSVTGWVIDAKCASNVKMRGNVDCAVKCAAGGEKLVIVAEKDSKVYAVDNQEALKGHEGHYVSVSGKIDGDNLHVEKVTMLAQKTK